MRSSGLVERDVTRSLRGPSAPRNLPRALSREAVDALFRAASDSEDTARDTAVLELLYGCGLRVSELAGLKWRDIDMEERWLVVLGKGNKERRVPFGSYAQKALRDLAGLEGARGEFVFTGKKKKGSVSLPLWYPTERPFPPIIRERFPKKGSLAGKRWILSTALLRRKL
jgi:integrase/recombinase XerC